jgi:FixJ family two-component response regulator
MTRILVIDDNHEARGSTYRLLEKAGYDALGIESKDFDKSALDGIDLLVADTEPETCLKAYSMGLPIVYTPAHIDIDYGKLNEFRDLRLLPKPYDTKKLLEYIQELLSLDNPHGP